MKLRTKNNLKRQLELPSNYLKLTGTKLLLETMIRDMNMYIVEAKEKDFIIRYLTMPEALRRACIHLKPHRFHAHSQELGLRVKNNCTAIVSELIDVFLLDLIRYSKEVDIPVKELSSPALHLEHTEYLSYYLTSKLEGKPQKSSPLAILRNINAVRDNPIKERINKSKRKLTLEGNK